MSIDYTSTALINDVKRRITIPTSQTLYPDSDILEVLTRELHISVSSLYVGLREDYFSTFVDLACSSGVTTFDIPAVRAIGNKMVDVSYIPTGTPTQINKLFLVDNTMNYLSNGYWIQDNQINIPVPYANGSIRVSYLRKPAFLALTSASAQITSIDTGTNTVTCATVPSSWTTATIIDVIQGLPPFKPRADDITPVAVVVGASGTIEFTTLPTGLVVGDWICTQHSSPIAQVPPEAHNYLSVCASVQILQSLGASQEMQMMMAERTRQENAMNKLSSPRVENDQRRFIKKAFGSSLRY